MTSPDRRFQGTSRFELLRTLGEGGMGVVYEALDRERDSRVALKTIRLPTADGLARFKNEFRVLQDLQHPNLVRLDELFETEGTWFFTMELVEGTDFIGYVRDAGAGGAPLAAGTRSGGDAAGPGAHEPRTGSSSSSRPLTDADTRTAQVMVAPASTRAPRPTPALTHGDALEPPAFDERRLRHVLRQLVLALTSIHEARKVHRDVKPGNTLVTAEGRLVLLDFGLISDAFEAAVDHRAIGTVSYMAPEQLSRGPIGPAADWYAVGVMLYQALTGHRPFIGSASEIAELKQVIEPPAPSEVVAGVPADLDRLCVDLLAREPERRPNGREIAQRLGGARTSRPVRARHAPFLGRQEELERLRRAHGDVEAGRPVAVLVHGESGVGKSALLKAFLDELALSSAVILRGRCYERESVPYKAVDEVIEALGRHLAGRAADDVAAVLPERIALVAEVFPTLRQVPAIEAAARRGDDARALEPFQNRLAVFAALRALLAGLGARSPLVIAIDDLQWADADSLALLDALTRPPAPPLLLCATVRTSLERDGLDPASLRAHLGEDVRDLRVDRLPPDTARALAERLLGDSPDADAVTAIAIEAAGHPMFIEALANHRLLHPDRATAVRLDEALIARTETLGADATQLLELVCIAGGPVLQEVCAHALGVPFRDLAARVTALRAARLIKTHGLRRSDPVEPYHDRVRESVIASLDAEARRQVHRKLGDALEDSGVADAETLAFHFREAGERARAADYTARAAERARTALAFERAARLYRAALDLQPGDPAHVQRLRVGLAEALASTGRGLASAEAYVAAAEHAAPDDQLDLRRRAAEQLLLSGRIDEGLRQMGEVLAAIDIGAPKTTRRALVSFVIGRARLLLRGTRSRLRLRDPSTIADHELRRIDMCWAMAVGMAIVDPIRGADFQTRHLLLALRSGDPYRIACGLAAEASFSAAAGNKTYPRTVRLCARARELAEQTGRPEALGQVAFAEGMTEYFMGRWVLARERFDQAATIFRDRCAEMAWWIDSAAYLSLECIFYAGDVRELRRRVLALLVDAQARGDLYAATNLQAGLPHMVWLFADDLEAARHHVADSVARWSVDGFHIQHESQQLAQVQTFLYEGDAEAAYHRFHEIWPTLRRSAIFTVQLARITGHLERARVALAVAASAEPGARRRRRRVAEAERAIGKMRRERMPWGDALAALTAGGARHLAGDPAGARAALDAAVARFEAHGMALHAAIARLRRGRLTGDTAEIEAATAWMRAQGIARPERIAAVLAPGF